MCHALTYKSIVKNLSTIVLTTHNFSNKPCMYSNFWNTYCERAFCCYFSFRRCYNKLKWRYRLPYHQVDINYKDFKWAINNNYSHTFPYARMIALSVEWSKCSKSLHQNTIQCMQPDPGCSLQLDNYTWAYIIEHDWQ